MFLTEYRLKMENTKKLRVWDLGTIQILNQRVRKWYVLKIFLRSKMCLMKRNDIVPQHADYLCKIAVRAIVQKQTRPIRVSDIIMSRYSYINF